MRVSSDQEVAVRAQPNAQYPSDPPFHPSFSYPEYKWEEVSSAQNSAYDCVRMCFMQAGLDAMNQGKVTWNPLRTLIAPGQTVLLKPNLVKESHPRDPGGWKCILTHGSVIRAVADYVWKALQGRGRVILADAPQTDSSFDAIIRTLGLDRLQAFYRSKGLDLEIVDLRQEEWTARDGVIVARRRISGDPHGGVAFDLADSSEFNDHGGAGNYYGADYDARVVNHHHSGGRHEYLIAATAIECDVLFSIPKLKTHKKAGITVSLKNLVGVNGDKNWLPHHTEGVPESGGDERPNHNYRQRLERTLVSQFRRMSLRVPGLGTWAHRRALAIGRHIFGDTDRVIRSGNWSGNDTLWRMALDLNKLVMYGNTDGTLREPLSANRKRHLVLVDGIVAGEGSGPLNPDPVPAGLTIFGVHPASVDAACAYLMGFDPEKLPIIRNAFRCRQYPLADWGWRDVRIVSNIPEWNGLLPNIPDHSTLHFRPHFGWVGRVERSAAPATI